MTDQEVYKKIEETYNSEKGKKFIQHLLRSFFPVQKTGYLFENNDKRVMKCCITGQALASKVEMLGKAIEHHEEHFKAITEKMIADIDENQEKVAQAKEKLKEAKEKITNGKVLAIVSLESDKLMCQQAFDQLQIFLTNKILRGVGEFRWLLKSMQKNEFIKHRNDIGKPIQKQEEKALNKVVNTPAKMNMMDNAVLQNLKSKLENEEKDTNSKK